MRMAWRFLLPLGLVLALLAWATSPLLGDLIGRWLRKDVELRSQLVFYSVQDAVIRLAKDPLGLRLDTLFERITRDERLLAMGLCVADGRLLNHTPNWPLALGCPQLSASPVLTPGLPVATYDTEYLGDDNLLIASLPLVDEGSDLGRLLILHDLRDRKSVV